VLFEVARDYCDLVLNLDSCNVKARFRRARAQALRQLGKVEAAYNYLLLAFKSDPSNHELQKKLDMVK